MSCSSNTWRMCASAPGWSLTEKRMVVVGRLSVRPPLPVTGKGRKPEKLRRSSCDGGLDADAPDRYTFFICSSSVAMAAQIAFNFFDKDKERERERSSKSHTWRKRK